MYDYDVFMTPQVDWWRVYDVDNVDLFENVPDLVYLHQRTVPFPGKYKRTMCPKLYRTAVPYAYNLV